MMDIINNIIANKPQKERSSLIQKIADELDDNSHALSLFEMTRQVLSNYDLTLKELCYLVVTRPKIKIHAINPRIQREIIIYIINKYGVDNLELYDFHKKISYTHGGIECWSILSLKNYLDKKSFYKVLDKYLNLFNLADTTSISFLFNNIKTSVLATNEIIKKFADQSLPNQKVFIFFKLNLKLKRLDENLLLDLFAASTELDENTQPLYLEQARKGKKVVHISSKYSKLITLLKYEGIKVKVHG
jgi:hypothetical protein